MRESFPSVTVVEDLHVVEDGHLITSAGISAGIDLALRVVARYHGEEVARATARQMEYRYPDDNRRRVETIRRRDGRWWDRWLRIVKPGSRRQRRRSGQAAGSVLQGECSDADRVPAEGHCAERR
jgi:hypothetical protein